MYFLAAQAYTGLSGSGRGGQGRHSCCQSVRGTFARQSIPIVRVKKPFRRLSPLIVIFKAHSLRTA